MTLALPSIWNILISTIVFFMAVWYFNRLLNEQGIRKGMTRGLVVFVLAYLVSWGVGELVDWVAGPQPQVEVSQDAAQLLKQLGAMHR
ncbi:MAG: hypothetical protein KJ850_00935 [Gammaproteobacteria bacterium]|nr:hypothetical protein [Gammaproteobacteria bacterium]MBU1623587.1 hypothetical protein [Gammaproteobacteria bacterium]